MTEPTNKMGELLLELIFLLKEEQKVCDRMSRELLVDHIDAVFWLDDKRKEKLGTLNVIEALDSLANDVHIYEDFDLHDAVSVTIETV